MRNIALFNLFLISLFLFGCQSEANTLKHSENALVQTEAAKNREQFKNQRQGKETLNLNGVITKVTILSGKEKTVFEDEKSIEVFQEVLTSAVKENGIINMANPEYSINISFENGEKQTFYLWLGDKGEKSVIMNADDTHIIYNVSEGITEKVNDLMNL